MSRPARYVLGLLLVLLAGAGIAYWVQATRADSVLSRGRAALARGDWHLTQRSLEQLERRGNGDRAHFLRGELWLYQARRAPEPATEGPPSLSAGPSSYQR